MKKNSINSYIYYIKEEIKVKEVEYEVLYSKKFNRLSNVMRKKT